MGSFELKVRLQVQTEWQGCVVSRAGLRGFPCRAACYPPVVSCRAVRYPPALLLQDGGPEARGQLLAHGKAQATLRLKTCVLGRMKRMGAHAV